MPLLMFSNLFGGSGHVRLELFTKEWFYNDLKRKIHASHSVSPAEELNIYLFSSWAFTECIFSSILSGSLLDNIGYYTNLLAIEVLIVNQLYNIYYNNSYYHYKKKINMGRTCSQNGKSRIAFKDLTGEPRGQRVLGKESPKLNSKRKDYPKTTEAEYTFMYNGQGM